MKYVIFMVPSGLHITEEKRNQKLLLKQCAKLVLWTWYWYADSHSLLANKNLEEEKKTVIPASKASKNTYR